MSAVSGWEIAIKAALGRIETTRDIVAAVSESGFEELPLRLSHADELRVLPRHHRDPFDRMLVAQAMAEGLTLVTRDRMLGAYDVGILPAEAPGRKPGVWLPSEVPDARRARRRAPPGEPRGRPFLFLLVHTRRRGLRSFRRLGAREHRSIQR